MGDIGAEPSMEEILSSIKRIIAEEGEGAPPRQRRPQRPGSPATEPAATEPAATRRDEEVLELRDPMPVAEPPAPSPTPTPPTPAHAAQPVPAAPAEPLLSEQSAEASRGSLDALTRMIVKPEAGSDNTLEGMVRDMLRPMLRDWLDANLPAMVESMVAGEIARITGTAR